MALFGSGLWRIAPAQLELRVPERPGIGCAASVGAKSAFRDFDFWSPPDCEPVRIPCWPLAKLRQIQAAEREIENEQVAQLAQQELDELELDDAFQKHVFDLSDTPAGRAARAKRQELFERAYPDPAPTQAEPVTAEARAAAQEELKAYADNKGLGKELSRAMANVDAPQDRPEQQGRVLARWQELNKIASAPTASPGAETYRGQPMGGAAMTTEQALAEIATLEKNPDLWNADTPVNGLATHRALVARRNKLYAIAFPESAT